ncbi:MAG: DUF6220 domain-containing protein [Candidatus Limnocylindrales bacterium]
MLQHYARLGFLGTAWLFVAGTVVQVFLAGLGVFGVPAGDFSTHRSWGYTFGFLLLVLVALGIIGRVTRRELWLSLLLIVLFALQSILVAVRAEQPAIAALHPLNGFAILLVGIYVALGARRYRRPTSAT